MRARRLIFAALACYLTAFCGTLFAQTEPDHPVTADDAATIIGNLRQVANELTLTLKRFESDLDREIAQHGQGYRTKSGRRIPGPDADLAAGPPAVSQDAARKLFAARLLAARRPGFTPPPVADADRIQLLIAEARRRIGLGNDLMGSLLVVSAHDLSPRREAEGKVRLRELFNARIAAGQAAKKALMALPIPLPDADSPDEQRESAWDLLTARLPLPHNSDPEPQPVRPRRDAALLPIRFDQGRRIALINEHSCRITLTDSGIEDDHARRLFFQEEWITRQSNLARTAGTGPSLVVVLLRWAVAVNTVTGQHTLLRQYQPREFQGDLGDVYRLHAGDYPVPETSPSASPPSEPAMTSATLEAARARQKLSEAVLHFKKEIRDALSRNDALLISENRPPLDDDFPPDIRETLFAVRARRAGTPAILDAENNLRRALSQATAAIQKLESRAAWFNESVIERDGPPQDSRASLIALNRSDNEIASLRSLALDALSALPPDVSGSEAQFPALTRDAIVRLRELASPPEGLRLRQEVWRLAGWVKGARQVARAAVQIEISRSTGSQIPSDRTVTYYQGDPGDSFEEIYNEYSAAR